MATVIVAMSMSLDGFVAGPNIGLEHPLGEEGERLHDWLFERNSRHSATASTHAPNNEVNRAVAQEVFASTGAVITGRRTYEVGIRHWGDTPYPAPTFVLTHEAKAPVPMKSASFTFVNDGIESALRQATAAAGARKIMLMGATVAQQFLQAGLLDEIQINLVPLLLGKGSRLFDHFGGAPIDLEITRVRAAAEVTHLDYRVVKRV